MKKTILSLVIILIAASSFSQSVQPNVKTQEYYLTKSRHQKTIGWILLGGGVALSGVGIAVAQAETDDYALGTDSHSTTGAALIIVGAASAIGSIPLFISAAHNKNKAATIGFNMQKTPMLFAVNNCTVIFQPALMLKIAL